MEKKENIKRELEQLAPSLAALDIKKKVEVKADYFDNLKDRVFEQIAQQKHLEESQLNEYFEKLPENVVSLLHTKKVSLVKYISAIAAIFIIVFASINLLHQGAEETETNLQSSFVESLQDEELLYLVSYLDSEAEIAMLLNADVENNIIISEDTKDILDYLDEDNLLEALEF